MKTFFSFWMVALSVAVLCLSCTPPASQQTMSQDTHMIGSTGLVGLWQQMQLTTDEDEETGTVLSAETPKPKFKCIMADGTYFLMEVSTREDGSVIPTILHYGTYTTEGDSLEIEHIEVYKDVPALNGQKSYVRYNMASPDLINLFYKFGVETGSPGSSEWNPEIWKRVKLN